MTMGPVTAALGVAQTIGGMAQQSRANAIQRAQVEASQQAADASAALRKAEIQSQKDFAAYQTRLNTLARQQQFMQASLGSQAEGILSKMQNSQQEFNVKQNTMQQRLQSSQQRGQADAVRAGTEQQYLGSRSAAAGQSRDTQKGLEGAARQSTARLGAGEQRRAMVQSILAATTGTPGRTEEVLELKDLGDDVYSALVERLAMQGISEQDLRQLEYSKGIAEIARELGIGSAEFLRQNANRSDVYSGMLEEGSLRDLATSSALADANRAASMVQLSAAMSSDENADRVNEIMAESGFRIQSQNTDIQRAQQSASLAAQSASIKGGGFFNLLGAGLNAYNILSQSLPNRPSQGGGTQYGILNNYKLNEFSGNVQDGRASQLLGTTSQVPGLNGYGY